MHHTERQPRRTQATSSPQSGSDSCVPGARSLQRALAAAARLLAAGCERAQGRPLGRFGICGELCTRVLSFVSHGANELVPLLGSSFCTNGQGSQHHDAEMQVGGLQKPL